MRISKNAKRVVSGTQRVIDRKAGKPLRKSRRIELLAAIAVGSISLVQSQSVLANSYVFDPNMTGFGSDGSGNWDTITPIWYNLTTSSDTAYTTNATTDIASFGAGTAGNYNVAVDPGGINVGTINFTTSGYNLAGGPLTLGSPAVISTSAGVSSSIASNITGSGDLAITGGGSLTLSGSDTFGGTASIGTTSGVTTSLTIAGGGLNPGTSGSGGFFIATTSGSTGLVTMTAGTASTNFYFSVGQNGYGTLNMSGGTITSNADFNVGNQSTALGIVNLSGTGTITQTQVNGNSGIVVGQKAGGQGIVNQMGGTVNQTTSGEYLELAANDPGSAGVWNMSGGTVNVTGQTFIGAEGSAAMYITGGTFNANNYVRVGALNAGSSSSNTVLTSSVLDVSGGVFNQSNGGQALTVGELNNGTLNIRGTGTVYAGTLAEGGNPSVESRGQTGIVNLLSGGTLVAGSIGYNGIGTTYFNFNGGTLLPSGSNSSFFNNATTAYVYSGGAHIDTSNGSVTIAQALLAPSGNGVSSVAVSGGPSYLAPPVVTFTGGGGSGASGVATLSSTGNLTGIIITNPGVGYTSAPTVLLDGTTLSGISNSSSYTTASTSADIGGGLIKTGNNTLTLTSPSSTFTGAVNIASGTLVTGSGNGGGAGPLGSTSVVRNIYIQSGATLNFAGGDVIGAGGSGADFVNVVGNSGSSFIISASGSGNSLQNLTLNGASVTTGNGYSVAYPTLTIGGTVTVGGTSASTISSSTPTGGSNDIALGLSSTSNSITFNVADATSSNSVDLSISTPLGTRGGTGAGTANSGSLIKTGAGTLALSGSNFYTGGTTINAGTLQANVSSVFNGTTLTSSSTGTGTVTLNGGVLAGTGGTGNVIVNSGATITAGTGATLSDTVGTLATGNQTWNSGGGFFDKVGASTNDLLIMTGLTINATTIVGAQFNVTAASVTGSAQTLPSSSILVLADDTEAAGSNPFNGAASLGKFNLITTQLAAAPGYSLQLGTQSDTTGNGGYDLVLAEVSTPTSITYTGAINGSFDTSTQNFQSSLGATAFSTGNTVLFDDTAVGTTTVTVTAAGVAPTALNFNNSSKSYIFNGGPITSGVVNVTGGGVVSFNSSNTYTGNTNISNGTLILGSTGSIASVNVVVGGSGKFVMLPGAQAMPFSLVDGGSASFNNSSQTLLALTGSGTVNLNGAALTVGALTKFTGGFGGTGGSLNISAGTVAINNTAGFNGVTGGITVGSATLVVPDGSSSAGIVGGSPITVTLAAGSTLQTPDGASTTFAGNINVTGATSITAGPTNASSSTLTLSGVISGSGPINFAGTGLSTVKLAAYNTYTGETRLAGDGSASDSQTLKLGINNGMSSVSGLAVTGTTTGHVTVDLNGFNQSVAYLGGVAGINNMITTSTGSSILNINNGNIGTVPASSSTPITGAITLTKTGAGNQLLFGTSNYSGGTTVSAGTLTAASASALGTGTVTLNGGTLQLGATGSSSVSGFTSFATNGGSNTSGGTVLNLTADNGGIQQTSAFTASSQALGNSGFVASFTYNDSHSGTGNIGDGMAFVIQNDSRGSSALGGPGGALGYGNNGNGSITQIGGSCAVDFNLYFAYTPGTAFSTNGTVPSTFASTSPVDLTDTNPHVVTLTYNAAASTLNETISSGGSSYSTTYTNVNYESLLGGNTGYVGFTGGTYAATAAQSISNFSFSTFNSPLSISNSITSTASTTSTISFPVSLISTTASIGSLNVIAGSKVVINSINSAGISGRGVLVIPSLTVAGTLDIGTNDLDLTSNDLASTTALVASGFNGGTFDGSGITSSAAASDTSHLHTVGVISNNVSNAALYGSASPMGLFDGADPGLNDVLVKYTYYGDANLDGVVDGSDYSLIDNGYINHLTGWYNGDFNYDGVVNGTDYTLIDNAFNRQGAAQNASGDALLASATAQLAATTAVPEPATTALLVLGATGLLGRRRGRNANRKQTKIEDRTSRSSILSTN